MNNKSEHDWQFLIFESLITFIPIYVLTLAILLIPTWEIGTEWGSIKQHWRYIWPSMKGWFNDANWHYYKKLLEDQGYLIPFYIHFGIPAAIATVTASCATWFWIIEPTQPDDRHISGPRLIPSNRVKGHAVAQFKRENGKKIPGINLHPLVVLPQKRELGNFLVLGMQGSGKSVVLKNLFSQVVERGDKALIYDQKREYTPLFFTDNTVMVSPTDARGTPWNISADACNDEMALLIAASFIRPSKEPIWGNGARLILAGCISTMNKTIPQWGWQELATMLTLPAEPLKEALIQHFPRAASLISGGESKTTDSFISTILSEVGWIFSLAEAWPTAYEDGFSIQDWLQNDSQPTIIIPFDQKYSTTCDSLCVALLNLMIANTLDLPDSDERRLWFVVDELGNMPRCENLEAWLSLGRSKGARTLAGTQNISQLQSVYDHMPAETLLGLFNNVIALKMGNSGESANVVSRALGVHDIERLVVTRDADGRESRNWQRERDIPLIPPDVLKHLPQADKQGVRGFATVGGWNSVYELCWPYPQVEKIAEPFIPADWLSSPKPAVEEKAVSQEDEVIEVPAPEESSWRNRGRRKYHCSEDTEGEPC